MIAVNYYCDGCGNQIRREVAQATYAYVTPCVRMGCPNMEGVHYRNPMNTKAHRLAETKPKAPTEAGVKHDGDKPMMHLLAPTWTLGVAQVLTYGAKKYPDAYNWRKGIVSSRYIAAALRHIFAWLGGEDLDKESGLHHLWHASACLMFCFEICRERPELDDRYRASVIQNPPAAL
jgi:hypothetical protein